MNDSQLSQFLTRINSDDVLRKQVEDAEAAAVVRTERLRPDIEAVSRENLEALRAIALEHGYDVDFDEALKTSPVTPNDQEIENARCLLTCCWVATSVWHTEGIPTVEGPGCGPGTTSDCPF